MGDSGRRRRSGGVGANNNDHRSNLDEYRVIGNYSCVGFKTPKFTLHVIHIRYPFYKENLYMQKDLCMLYFG